MKQMKIKGNGTCYQDSCTLVLDLSALVNSYSMLIHGTVYSIHFGKRIKHAWVELGREEDVIDAATGQFFRQEEWKRIAQPIRLHSYTQKQVREMVLSHGTYGPWEGYLGPYPSTYGYDKKEQERVKKIHRRNGIRIAAGRTQRKRIGRQAR